MRIIIRGIESRKPYIDYLKYHLPQAEWCMDQKRDAMDTFLRAMEMAGDDPCVHMEDDALLTTDFYAQMIEVIKHRPNEVINFFSRRKDDLSKGSRYSTSFLYNLCFYAPAGISRGIREYKERWPRLAEHPTGTDYMIDDYLRERGIKHWLHVPSLVDHRQTKSMIDPRRSTRRSSLTFKP